MVIYLDVDDYLHIEDYRLCINDARWPWKETHFVKLNFCFICGLLTNSRLPRHFFCRTDLKITFQMLCKTKHFWCLNCAYAIYEHYPSGECEFCVI